MRVCEGGEEKIEEAREEGGRRASGGAVREEMGRGS